MTEPNPTIDLAKAKADLQAAMASSGYAQASMWAAEYGKPLLTALEQMQDALNLLRSQAEEQQP